MDPQTHLAEIKARLSSSPVVETVAVLLEYTGRNYGYLRARLTLINRDFLEVAEYFAVKADAVEIERYRHQWMDQSQAILKRRWDNTKHFPDLPNFPHHIHVGGETQVTPGQALGILDLIDFLEQELVRIIHKP